MSVNAGANVVEISPDELVAQARACPVLVTARKLAEWIGPTRKVTTRGVLQPAAAVEACELLGLEVPPRKPRSALDLPELMMVWAAASAAEFIEVAAGRVTAGPGLGRWLDGAPQDVLTIWAACAAESLSLTGEADPEDMDYLVVLAALHECGGTASAAQLLAAFEEMAGGPAPICECPDCTAPDPSSGLGAFEDVVQALGEFGIAEVRGSEAALTPLGLWFTDLAFRENAPPPDAGAPELVAALTGLPDMASRLMARPWLAARTPAAAAGELLSVAAAASGQERLDALALARACGPEGTPAWREWAARDGFGAHARLWLAELDGTEPAELDEAWAAVDTLTVMLDDLAADAPADFLPTILQVATGPELTAALPLLDECGHPDAPRLVALLGGVPEPLPAPGPPATYQIKVQLRYVTKPPVWRRLRLPAGITLDRLHEVVQAAMGWENYHMHVFSHESGEYGVRDPELGYRDEREVSLSQLLTAPGDKIVYTYDFGDGWEHDIVLEEILPPEGTGPVCVTGRGACPPEDCGGSWGYTDLKHTLADPNAEDHKNMLEWLDLASGDEFDPKHFSPEEANRRLRP